MRSFEKELLRKLIHFLGVFYIPLYMYGGKEVTLTVVITLTVFSGFIELIRKLTGRNVFPELFLNPYEIGGIGAHLYFGISTSILTLFMSMEAAITGVLVGCAGDGIAGILKAYIAEKRRDITSENHDGERSEGRLLPSTLINLQKLPSVAMFVLSFSALLSLNVLFSLSLDMRVVFISCIVGTLIESRTVKVKNFYINDNLTVPLLSGMFYQALS